MARKLIQTLQLADESKVAKIYRDAEWDEYRVVFYFNGVKQQDADYHTTDKQDALDTAQSWVTSARS